MAAKKTGEIYLFFLLYVFIFHKTKIIHLINIEKNLPTKIIKALKFLN